MGVLTASLGEFAIVEAVAPAVVDDLVEVVNLGDLVLDLLASNRHGSNVTVAVQVAVSVVVKETVLVAVGADEFSEVQVVVIVSDVLVRDVVGAVCVNGRGVLDLTTSRVSSDDLHVDVVRDIDVAEFDLADSDGLQGGQSLPVEGEALAGAAAGVDVGDNPNVSGVSEHGGLESLSLETVVLAPGTVVLLLVGRRILRALAAVAVPVVVAGFRAIPVGVRAVAVVLATFRFVLKWRVVVVPVREPAVGIDAGTVAVPAVRLWGGSVPVSGLGLFVELEDATVPNGLLCGGLIAVGLSGCCVPSIAAIGRLHRQRQASKKRGLNDILHN